MIFKKIKINKHIIKNRIAVSPMCQYSAKNGCPTEWHYRHLTNLIETGAGMLVVESTAVNSSGRITSKDLCMYNKDHAKSHKKLIKHLKKINNIPIILQISHSGRKGSSFVPWIKKNKPLKKKDGAWNTFAPSAIRRDDKWPTPKAMNMTQIINLIRDFKKSAEMALKSGYDGVEVHMAHGYLLHQFFSPISNLRKDQYGQNLNNRCKLHLQIIQAIKKINVKNKNIGARITGTDHLNNGITIKDSIYLVKKLKKSGLNYVCVSSGGILPKTNMKFKEGFRVEMAKKIKRSCKILTRTSGLITSEKLLNNSLRNNSIDMVAVGRKLIRDKMWIYKIAKNEKFKKITPSQYLRCF